MKKYKHSIVFGLLLVFFAGLLALFALIWQIGYREATFFYAGNYLVIAIYGIILLLFLTIYGGWKIGELRVLNLILSGIIALFFSNAFIYLILCLIARQMLSPWEILIVFFIQSCWCIFSYYLINKVYFSLRQVRKVAAVLGDNPDDEQTITKMNSLYQRFHIDCIIDAFLPINEIYAQLEPYESVLLCTIPEDLRSQLFHYCYCNQKRINLIPQPMDIVFNHATQTQIIDVPILFCRNTKLKTEQAVVKRLVDLLFSFLALLITSPIFLFTMIAIKIEDHGPVFFRQTRLTKNGKRFEVIKFRSMHIHAESGTAKMAETNDPRITKVGRLIRAARIDELPQLINILQGNMSVVGPRPERPEFYEIFSKELPEFMLRLNVKAGLTGYAQIYGRYNTSPKNKLNLDLFYIESYSLLLDIRLMLMTFKILFMKESTDGVDNNFNKQYCDKE